MFAIYLLLFFCGFPKLFIKSVDNLFTEIGDYPNLESVGVNHKTCGIGIKPQVVKFQQKKQCFLNSHPNQTAVYMRPKPSNEFSEDVSSRIFNGHPAVLGESPWSVGMSLTIYKKLPPPRGSTFFKVNRCSGVLIAFNWILTSKECTSATNDPNDQNYDYGAIKSVAGYPNPHWANNVRQPPRFRVFSPPITGPDWHKLSGDLALIRLLKPYPDLNDRWFYYINPVCVPKYIFTNDDIYNKEEEKAFLSGYGFINREQLAPEEAHITGIKLRPHSECKHGLNMLCAEMTGDEGRPCQHDMGGPVIQYSDEEIPRAVIVGTVTMVRNSDCFTSNKTAKIYFEPIRNYVKWIVKTIEDNLVDNYPGAD